MPSPTIINHGTPVVTARQWVTGLSPNPAGDGWNYIAQSWVGPNPGEWVVLKDLTGVPSAPHQTITQTPNHVYGSILYQISNGKQLRAANGRIFFLMFGNYTVVYDPTTEGITLLGPVVETPPVDPNASWGAYSASFDTAGQLWTASEESHFRPSCVVVTDPASLGQSIAGYVGSGAGSYSTYGYRIAPDTGTSTKFVYVVYGENPWQLWALETVSGTATLLDSVSSNGNIAFTNIAGQGWVATVDTDLGKPDNVRTQFWCLDGALYPYTVNVAPPGGLARNVTPASNPLVGAPGLDVGGGIGVVGWRPNGSVGAYTYVNYTVQFTAPQAIESLVVTPTGVLGNAVSYQGFFNVTDASGNIIWYGAEGGLDISEGPRLNVSGVPDAIYLVGYPDGILYLYDPAQSWQASAVPTKNPLSLGVYGPSGNQLAGIKYATCIAWSATAGASGRLYCAGVRERTGSGAGIGYYDKTTKTFAGTFAAPLDVVQPGGLLPTAATGALVALDTIARVVMSTRTLSGSGTATLYVFDHNLNIIAAQTPIATSNLGQIFPTNDAGGNIVCGVMQSGTALAVYRHNVSTNTLLDLQVTAHVGTVGFATTNPSDGSIWVSVGNAMVRVDPDTLVTSTEIDITAIAPVFCQAFYGANLYMASGATLFSAEIAQTNGSMTFESGAFEVDGSPITFSTGTHGTLSFGSGAFEVDGAPITFSANASMTFRTGTFFVRGSDINFRASSGELYFDLPTIPTQGRRGTELIYSDSPFVIQRRIPPNDSDPEES